MSRKSNYDKYPKVPISASAKECWVGWPDINSRLRSASAETRCVLCVECYPGAFERDIKDALEEGLRPAEAIYAPDLLKPTHCIDEMLSGVLGDDPVFGRMNNISLHAFFIETKPTPARERVACCQAGLLLTVVLVAGLV